MGDAKRIIIGSESNDDRKIELEDLNSGVKIVLPVSLFNAGGNLLNLPSGLVSENFNYISLSYDSSDNLTGVVYKTGGSGGTTVATLTLTYDNSNNLETVTKT